MTPSKITFEFKSLEKQLFLANLVDPSRRLAMASHSVASDCWPHLCRYLEEDTGLFISSQMMKNVAYAGLYGAGNNTLVRIARDARVLSDGFDDIGIEEAQEIRDWLFLVSDSPYFLQETDRISHVTFMRAIQNRIYSRYGDRAYSIYFDWDKLEIGFTTTNVAALDRITNEIGEIIDNFIDSLDLGFTTGLYRASTTVGER